ncbi:hypothetical protein GGU11DRAFT_794819 [Lentinula aff. detonsa]|nr:hypothetical protein GGU11DRAFT_794819 [Lentinula aff. detonsa]
MTCSCLSHGPCCSLDIQVQYDHNSGNSTCKVTILRELSVELLLAIAKEVEEYLDLICFCLMGNYRLGRTTCLETLSIWLPKNFWSCTPRKFQSSEKKGVQTNIQRNSCDLFTMKDLILAFGSIGKISLGRPEGDRWMIRNLSEREYAIKSR